MGSFAVLGSYPTATLAARLSVEQLYTPWAMEPSCCRAGAIASVILTVSAVGALFLDDLGEIVEVVGAIGGFGLFVLPSIVYCNLRYPDEQRVWARFVCWPGLVGAIGLAIAVLNATLVVVNLASGRDGGGEDPCGAPPPAV